MPATEPPQTYARARLRRLALAVVPALASLVATASASAATFFSNPAPIATTQGFAPAVPYPSEIAVGGLGGPIADVAVTLHRVGHTNPDDLDVLLVSPSGDKVMLMSDACGVDDIEDYSWTFSQQAPRAMSDDSSDCGAFAYRPTDYPGTGNEAAAESMFSPAPPRPYGTSLASFDNEKANGTWKLYVQDDFALPVSPGDIEVGWSLAIETRPVDTAIPGRALWVPRTRIRPSAPSPGRRG